MFSPRPYDGLCQSLRSTDSPAEDRAAGGLNSTVILKNHGFSPFGQSDRLIPLLDKQVDIVERANTAKLDTDMIEISAVMSFPLAGFRNRRRKS